MPMIRLLIRGARWAWDYATGPVVPYQPSQREVISTWLFFAAFVVTMCLIWACLTNVK